MAIPALLSKKLNGRPVMMRISREEETYIGRTRPGFQAWAKMGFKKDGRVTAIDAFIIEDSGPYRGQGDNAQAANLATLLYQAPNARFRGLSVATNTPPRVSQRAPGGLQSAILFEPLVNKAAKQLGVDQVEIRKINAPVNGSPFGLNPVAQATRPRTAKVTSSYVKEALDRGRASCSTGKSARSATASATAPRSPASASATAPSPRARSASTGCSSSSLTARCTSIRASATSARTR